MNTTLWVLIIISILAPILLLVVYSIKHDWDWKGKLDVITPKLDGKSKWIILGIVVMIVGFFLLKDVVKNSNNQDIPPKVKSVAAVEQPREIRWKLHFVDDPEKREYRYQQIYEVEILRNNENVFWFLMYYQHQSKRMSVEFLWNKTETHGIWRQEEPLEYGTWFLEKDTSVPFRYNGRLINDINHKILLFWIQGN